VKKLENMTLEELIKLENEIRVLSFYEYDRSKHFIKRISTKSNIEDDYQNYRTNLPIYIILNEAYNIFLEDLVTEINHSSIEKDVLSIAILIGDFLIPKGLLGYTKKFHNTDSDRFFTIVNTDFHLRYNEIEGLYILAGYGCCRHINSFISDVIKKYGLESDKIECIQDTPEEIKKRIQNNNFDTNHLLTGYIINNQYHLIDCYNHIYSLQKTDEFYECERPKKIILDLSQNSWFQKKLYWKPNIEYYSNTKAEITKRQKQIERLLNNGELKRFIKFKQNHFELIKKIAYLAPLELERTEDKEKMKVKRI